MDFCHGELFFSIASGSFVSGLKVEALIRDLIPFYLIIVIALVVIIFLPQLSQGFAEMIYK